MTTRQPEPEVLRGVLERTDSLTEAAQQLGVSRPTLYRWISLAGVTDFHRRVRLPNHGGDLDG